MRSSQYSGSVVGLIVVITMVPLVALSWLGWRLLEQDRMLEAQQIQDRVDRTADLIVAEIGQAISNTGRRLASGDQEWPEGALAIFFEGEHFSLYPGKRAAFVPAAPKLPGAPASAFAGGERLEFQLHDPLGAVEFFRETAKSDDVALRAGALHRLGRNLFKSGLIEEALGVYTELSRIDGVLVDGVPAGLVGHFARLKILEMEDRTADLITESRQLSHDLRHARWSLTEPVYRLYLTDADRWHSLDEPDLTQAELFGKALQNVWIRRDQVTAPARESISVDGVSLAVVWEVAGEAKRALIASRTYVESQWLDTAAVLAENGNVRLTLRDLEGRVLFGETADKNELGTERLAQVTLLPWTVSVTSTVFPGQDPAFARRRQLLIAGFVLVATMALTASYLIFRGVSRERALVRMQSEFVGTVSHEFRTPLTALRQFTDMLREARPLGDDRRRVCYEALAGATDRLQHLVESLLDFGQMEAGARTYRLEPLDCARLVRETVEAFQAETLAADHEVRLNADRELMIEGDSEALARALHNLLDNAVKYSPGRNEIDVTVQSSAGGARISVRDYGIGISASERDAIFARFKRGERARARGIRGTGIGLAMVEEIIRAHGGRVEVDSAPDQGSTFIIFLPLRNRGE